MSYTRVNWQNKPSTATPINATNLNTMDAGIAALDTAMADKVDKVAGKGLSTEDFTSEEKTKLAGIEDGAEVNVQADWDEADNTADDYIKNKPDLSVYAERDELWGDGTASGNPVTIKTQSAQNAKQTILTMTPIQSGSGTPAPDNVRPISGRTQVEIVVKDSDDVTQSTVTISLGQTVYGGTLDVETGELTIDRQILDLGTLNWSLSTSSGHERFNCRGFVDNIVLPSSDSTLPDIICSQYATATNNQNYNHTVPYSVALNKDEAWIYVYDPDYTDAQTFTAAMNGVKVCFKLATPTTATLTAAQVALIKGINNISTNADSLTITYFNDAESLADADNRITGVLGDFAKVEGKTASQNYAIGDYLIFSDKFCKASSAIASGETLAIGSNLTQTTIGAELKAILAQL